MQTFLDSTLNKPPLPCGCLHHMSPARAVSAQEIAHCGVYKCAIIPSLAMCEVHITTIEGPGSTYLGLPASAPSPGQHHRAWRCGTGTHKHAQSLPGSHLQTDSMCGPHFRKTPKYTQYNTKHMQLKHIPLQVCRLPGVLPCLVDCHAGCLMQHIARSQATASPCIRPQHYTGARKTQGVTSSFGVQVSARPECIYINHYRA